MRSGPQQAGTVEVVVELVDDVLVELVLEVLVELVELVLVVLVELVELVLVLEVLVEVLVELVVVLELSTGHPPGAGASLRLKRFDWFFTAVPPSSAQ